MQVDEEKILSRLVFGHRWAALATVNECMPFSSYVAYAAESDEDGFLIHVSRLAWHTRNLLVNPQASLSISDNDDGNGDPQTLARVSLQGTVMEIPRDGALYHEAKTQYLSVLPGAEQFFSFSDFVLFKLTVEQVRLVVGFGKSFTLSSDTLQRVRRAYI